MVNEYSSVLPPLWNPEILISGLIVSSATVGGLVLYYNWRENRQKRKENRQKIKLEPDLYDFEYRIEDSPD